MEINLRPVSIHLAKGQTLKVRDGEGYRVLCHSGNLWITQDRDTRDIVLQPGESFAFDRPGLALVRAFEPAAIRIEAVDAVRVPVTLRDGHRFGPLWAASRSRAAAA
jgi:hypothetical protein